MRRVPAFSDKPVEPRSSRQAFDAGLLAPPIDGQGVPALDPYGVSNLTRNQLQVWIGQNLLPEAPIYNLATALHIEGKIDREHFDRAFRVLVNSSDALRTVVEANDGIPMQRVLPEGPVAPTFLDYSQQSDADTQAKNWMENRCRVPLGWRGALYDSALIKIAPGYSVWYLNAHHLICDGSSFELIYRHMSELYRASIEGRLPQHADMPAFADYQFYERAHRESSRHRKAEAYWTDVLAKPGEVVNFYGNLPLRVTSRVRRISQELGAERTKRLKALAAAMVGGSESAALFDVFAAVLVGYLCCLNGNETYTIGVPFHNRRSQSAKQTIGFFSEVLPVRVTLAEDETFASLSKKFGAEVRRTLRYGQHAVANPFFNRLYEVTLNYHTRSFSEFAGMPARPEWLHNGHGDESLGIQIRDFGSANNLAVDFDLHEGIFDEQDGGRVVDHFFRVLDAFLLDSGQHVRRLSLTSPQETQRLLVGWNAAAEQTASPGVCRFFEEQARQQPDAVAVLHAGERLTYGDLNRRANALAQLLRSRIAGRETPIGVYLTRSPDMIVAMLGVLKAGAAYVPIDPQYSSEWLKYILEETEAPILLTQRSLLAALPEIGVEALCLDDPAQFDGCQGDNLAIDTGGADLAYIIYTSGSSGTPKGVEITHGALANFAREAARNYEITSSDRVLQFASISFDTSVEEIFPCLTSGATLVLRSDSMLDSTPAFLEQCRTWGITVLDLPTAFWHELTTTLFSERRTLPESLRLVIIGGERAIMERLALWQACVAGTVRLVNTYGPTEATVVSTICDLTHVSAECGVGAEVAIGRPITNVQTLVLDQNLNPLPEGVPGELYIGGVGLARGYLRRTDLTAEKFIPNPFDNGAGTRLYKTGDIVRYRQDGNLEFLRRNDDQIKVRGFRVELEGIASVLRQHPLIRDAAVAQEAARHTGRLVAYVVAEGAGVLNLMEIQNFVRTKLPEYMVPAVLIPLDSLPLNASGKVDRRALVLPRDTGSATRENLTPPQTLTEQRIAGIWCELLSLQRIGRDQHFFELGGHSLLAAQAVSRLGREFRVDIPLRAIFEAPTIGLLAERVEQTLRLGQTPEEMAPITLGSYNGQAPASDSQSRIWHVDQFAPDSAAYNITVAIRFTGTLDRAALRMSLDRLVERHESLRTTITNDGGQPAQVIASTLRLELPEFDLTSEPEERRIDLARELLREEGRRPFDLSRGPLLRLLLLRLNHRDHVLLLCMHHLISDQWSLGVVAREISSSYNALRTGDAPALDLPSVQYGDYAVWQNRRLAPERLQENLVYWKRQLAGMRPAAIQTDRPRPAVQTFRGAHQTLVLSRELIEKLRKIALDENASLYMVFLAAFKMLLSRYAGGEDVAVGSPVAGRTQVEWEGVIGTFINILVLRTDLSGNPSLRQIVQRVREVVFDAFTHQEMPFQRLVDELAPSRDASRLPLIDILFNFQNTPVGKIEFDDISWAPFELDQWASQLDLSVTIDPEVTRKIYLSYNTDLYDNETVARVLRHYEKILEALAADAKQSLATLAPLGIGTEGSGDDNRLIYPEACLHELFEAQAARTPDAVALAYEDRQLTYRELNEQANRAARRLRAIGVGPEDLVAICVERSPELVAALLAILKAGGAYVPIDPAYPKDRIAFVLEDSAATALVTEKCLRERLPGNDLPVLWLNEIFVNEPQESAANLEPLTGPDDLAYVISTSGSTGKPKGVQIPHRALVSFLYSMKARPGIGPEDILLSVTTISFDIAALELFLPLISGARVVIVSRETAADGRELARQLEASGASVMQGTPTTWRMMVEAGWNGAQDFKVICGGESWPLTLAKELCARNGSVWNLYGPTETTVWSSIWPVEPGCERISIGRPIHNTQIHILDSNGLPLPVGVPGEIYIGGEGVARGYLNRPDLTAEKFVPNPFGAPSSRLYRTGDVGRYLADGNIEFIGRVDNQVKVRGFRIELGEIEAVLSEHEAVSAAAVVVREDGDAKRMVAYVVASVGRSLTEKDLVEYAKQKLPSSMVPSAFVFLESLPLTPNGKIDRRALPRVEKYTPVSDSAAAPGDRLEFELTHLWSKCLGVSSVGLRDNFFELGGNSLLASRLIALIEKQFGKKIPLVDFFGASTVEGVAAFLRQCGCSLRWSSLVPIQPRGLKPPFFWVHGDASNFVLPRYLGEDQPLFGFIHQGHDGSKARYTTVESIAAHYLEELCGAEPAGPYFLGGYSFGGLVAFEMARQLSVQGKEVGLLVLLEPSSPAVSDGAAAIGSPRIIGDRNESAVGSYSRGDVIDLLDWQNALYAMNRIAIKGHRILGTGRLVKSAKRGMSKLFDSFGERIPASLRSTYILDVYMLARRAYQVSPYAGPVVFFNTSAGVESHAVWSRLVHGDYEVHLVSGNHMDLIREPQVSEWAGTLSAFLLERHKGHSTLK
jgi:amino acid adenylation domain-containing protein